MTKYTKQEKLISQLEQENADLAALVEQYNQSGIDARSSIPAELMGMYDPTGVEGSFRSPAKVSLSHSAKTRQPTALPKVHERNESDSDDNEVPSFDDLISTSKRVAV